MNNSEIESIGDNLSLLGMLILVSITLILLFGFGIAASISPAILIAAALLLLLTWNFNALVVLFLGFFFVEYYIYGLCLTELLGSYFLFSFLLMYRIKNEKLNLSLVGAYCVFLVSIMPSYFNIGIQHLWLWFWSIRYFSFMTILITFPIAFSDLHRLKSGINLFIIFAVINGISVIFWAMASGGREFGFSGVMYCDLVGIGITLALVRFLFVHKNRSFFISATILLSMASLFTQTRNSWIAICLTIIFVLILFVVFSGELGNKRSNALQWIISASAIFVFVAGVIYFFSPETFTRIENKPIQQSDDIVFVVGQSSLNTRAIIWHTAFNAFLAHPFIGIGNFNFQFVSEDYYSLSSALYGAFVKGLNPHLVIMELLSETGIIGTLGYFYFMVHVWKKIIGILKNSAIKETLYSSVSISAAVFYATISMLMTDAWLWGQLQMLLACIVAGIIIVENEQIARQALYNEF